MSVWSDDPLAMPSPDGGGGAESRIFHWLDHAVATLWFTSQPPTEEWSPEEAWRQLALVGGTLEFLGHEHDDLRALYSGARVLRVLDLFETDGAEEARQDAGRAAADISARMRGGYWPDA